jgi:methylmalonyl-CoA epimerase
VIEIVRFDHISIAVREMEPQVERLEGLFGFRYVGRFEEDAFSGANLEVPGSSDMGWEVLAPSGPDSYLHRFLNGEHGPGLHHVAMQVRDLDQAVEAMRDEGVEPWGTPGEGPDERPGEGRVPDAAESGDPADERGVVYIHPKMGGHGFLFQLYAGEAWHRGEPWEDEGEHTLGIKAINHLSHAHPSREQLADWYERVLGLQTIYRSPDGVAEAGFRTQVLETPTGQMRWEILEPAGSDSFLQRFLEQRGPSIHHVTFEVHDWQRALDACRYHGIQPFGHRDGITDGVPWHEAFIHPRDTGGMLAQIFWQAEPGVWI